MLWDRSWEEDDSIQYTELGSMHIVLSRRRCNTSTPGRSIPISLIPDGMLPSERVRVDGGNAYEVSHMGIDGRRLCSELDTSTTESQPWWRWR